MTFKIILDIRSRGEFRVRPSKEMFESRLRKLIEASERGEMIGDWNDYGRLLDYEYDCLSH